MNVDRRTLLSAAAATLTPAAALAQGTSSATGPVGAALSARAAETRMKLAYDGDRFSGPALDLLVDEGRAAQFFLLGEEHGIAENAKLAATLFQALAPAGYRHLGIEISPPLAWAMDNAARQGPDALKHFYGSPGAAVAFFGMAEESAMLAKARAAVPGSAPVLWGLDYEVGADRWLIAALEAAPKPRAAAAAVATLRSAATAAWAKYAETRNLQFAFSFAGDPQLVRAVRAAWPRPDATSLWALDVLEETLEINRLWIDGRGWDSNQHRARFIRANFVRHWRIEQAAGRSPKAMFKLGANHLVRGVNDVGTFDLGSLLPEVAALADAKTFSLMVLPGAESNVAVLDPATWTYREGSAKDNYAGGLELLSAQAYPDAFTLFDLRHLRPLTRSGRMHTTYPALMRAVNGYDALLIMSGSTPSRNF